MGEINIRVVTEHQVYPDETDKRWCDMECRNLKIGYMDEKREFACSARCNFGREETELLMVVNAIRGPRECGLYFDLGHRVDRIRILRSRKCYMAELAHYAIMAGIGT